MASWTLDALAELVLLRFSDPVERERVAKAAEDRERAELLAQWARQSGGRR